MDKLVRKDCLVNLAPGYVSHLLMLCDHMMLYGRVSKVTQDKMGLGDQLVLRSVILY